MIDNKVNKISNKFNGNGVNYSPKLFSSKLIMSSLSPVRNRVPRTMKRCDDVVWYYINININININYYFILFILKYKFNFFHIEF